MSKFRVETATKTPERIEVHFYRKNSLLLIVDLQRASFRVKNGVKNQGQDTIVIEFWESNRKIDKNFDKFSIVLEQLGFSRNYPYYMFQRELNPVKEEDFNNFIEVIMTLIEKLF